MRCFIALGAILLAVTKGNVCIVNDVRLNDFKPLNPRFNHHHAVTAPFRQSPLKNEYIQNGINITLRRKLSVASARMTDGHADIEQSI